MYLENDSNFFSPQRVKKQVKQRRKIGSQFIGPLSVLPRCMVAKLQNTKPLG